MANDYAMPVWPPRRVRDAETCSDTRRSFILPGDGSYIRLSDAGGFTSLE
jgi:hypothetical protein